MMPSPKDIHAVTIHRVTIDNIKLASDAHLKDSFHKIKKEMKIRGINKK
jgi:hypothetical protein